MFLTTVDYRPRITDARLNQLIQGDEATRLQAEAIAQEEMATYLRSRFNADAVFAATGAARNPLIITFLADMVIYHLWSRFDGNLSPEHQVQIRYDHAISWLKQVATGQLTPQLPVNTNADGTTQDRFRWGSNEKPELRF